MSKSLLGKQVGFLPSVLRKEVDGLRNAHVKYQLYLSLAGIISTHESDA